MAKVGFAAVSRVSQMIYRFLYKAPTPSGNAARQVSRYYSNRKSIFGDNRSIP